MRRYAIALVGLSVSLAVGVAAASLFAHDPDQVPPIAGGGPAEPSAPRQLAREQRLVLAAACGLSAEVLAASDLPDAAIRSLIARVGEDSAEARQALASLMALGESRSGCRAALDAARANPTAENRAAYRRAESGRLEAIGAAEAARANLTAYALQAVAPAHRSALRRYQRAESVGLPVQLGAVPMSRDQLDRLRRAASPNASTLSPANGARPAPAGGGAGPAVTAGVPTADSVAASPAVAAAAARLAARRDAVASALLGGPVTP